MGQFPYLSLDGKMPSYSSFWILPFGTWPKWRIVLLGSICGYQEGVYPHCRWSGRAKSLPRAWRIWRPEESYKPPSTTSLGGPFPKVVFRLTSIGRGDILSTEGLLFPHSCGKMLKGKWELGITLAYVLSASDENVWWVLSCFFCLIILLVEECVFSGHLPVKIISLFLKLGLFL